MTTTDPRIAQRELLQAALAGRWSIESELGRGGMGTVYLARDVALERPVAIKVLAPELAEDPVQRERFLKEARTGARLTHPHIVPIYAVEEAAESVYLVMGLVDGESLAERIHRRGPLGNDDARRVLQEIGWALGYAHAMGILHRDVTLDNILIDRRTSRAMLVDFGIASATDRTDGEPLIGTPAYLAPELIQGEAPTVASDLYSIGICGWAALAGRLPFQSEDVGSTLLQHLTAPIPSLADAAPGASLTLIRSIESCLEKDQKNRPHSVEAWLTTLQGTKQTVTTVGPLTKWVEEWSQVRAFYAMAFLLALIVGTNVIGWNAYASFWRTILGPVTFLAMATVPAYLVHRLVGLRMLRAVIRAGYGVEDLTLALSAKSRRGLLHRASASAVTRLATNVMKWAGIVLLVGAIVFWKPHMPNGRDINAYLRWSLELPFFVFFLAQYVGWAYQLLIGALTVYLLVNDRPTRLSLWLNRHRLAFWSSKRGKLAYRLAGVGLKRVAATPEATLHRPTELMLDLAIDDLWQALPASHQQRLKELPVLARSLRQRVAKLREIQEQVDTAGVRQTSEIRAIKQELAQRQAAGVTALERLRLLLMKLGSAALSEEEMTGPLAIARGTDEELLATLGAHRDLYRRLRQPTASPTPHPTPA